MFENMKAGWRLGRETRKLIMRDKQLFVYPLISAIVGILVFGALLASFLLVRANTVFVILSLFVYYVIIYFVSTYVIIAMLIAFRSYGKGNKISIGAAFSQASPYWKLVLEWAIFDATITMIIRAIESRVGAGVIARFIIGSIASFAFTLATYFVVPVIIDEKVGPIKAIKESTSFILKNFGKTFGGMAYADLYSLMFIAGGIAAIILGAMLAASTSILLVPGIAVLAIGFVLLVFGVMFSYIISNTVKLIIYDYMTDRGNLPDGWDKAMIDDALKKGRPGNPAFAPMKPNTHESFA